MKGRRAFSILLALTLFISLLPVQSTKNSLARTLGEEKPLRKIAFLADGSIFTIDEDGNGLTRLVEGGIEYGDIVDLKWSPDGRWVAYTSNNVFRTIRDPYVTGFSSADIGGPTIFYPGSFQGWVNDLSDLDFSNWLPFIIGSGLYRIGNEESTIGYIIATTRLSPRPDDPLGVFLGEAEQILFSPKRKFQVESKLAHPLDPNFEGISDPYVYELTIRYFQTRDFVSVLSDRWGRKIAWSYFEDKVAIHEKIGETGQIVLSVYSLPNTLIAQIDDPWFNGPALFLPDGKRLVYHNRSGYNPQGANEPSGLTLINLDTQEKKVLEGVAIQAGTHGVPEGTIRLAEAGTKLVYNNWGIWLGNGGIFIYDLETDQLTQIVSVGKETIFSWDIVGDQIVYVLNGDLYLTDLGGSPPKLVAKTKPFADVQVAMQPRISPKGFKNPRVLVLAQGIGSEVKEGYPHNVFPEYWPIIDEAIARGIYQDVIIFSYAGGRMEEGKWVPAVGHPEASFQSIKNSALVLATMLNQYETAHRGVTFDILGHSLGGKVAWEYLKMYLLLGEKSRPFKIGKLITLGSPLNGRHRDYLFQSFGQWRDELVRSQASDELHTEALNFPVQVITENLNIASFNQAVGEEIEVFNIASRDDCIVPYAERYPYNSALINGFGYLYREIGRGDKKGLGLADCFITDDNPLDPRDIVSVLQLLIAFSDADRLNIGAGHERYFWHPRIWMDLKDLILHGKRPARLNQK